MSKYYLNQLQVLVYKCINDNIYWLNTNGNWILNPNYLNSKNLIPFNMDSWYFKSNPIVINRFKAAIIKDILYED